MTTSETKTVRIAAADPKVGMTTGEIRWFARELDHAGIASDVRVRPEIGWRSQLRALSATGIVVGCLHPSTVNVPEEEGGPAIQCVSCGEVWALDPPPRRKANEACEYCGARVAEYCRAGCPAIDEGDPN